MYRIFITFGNGLEFVEGAKNAKLIMLMEYTKNYNMFRVLKHL